MSQTINVNGVTIQYPETGDTGWGDEATDFAIQTSAAFSALGLSTGTSVDITGTLDVTGATTLDSTLDVTGNTDLTGNLDVSGDANLTGDLDVLGNTDLNGTLDVALASIFASTVTIVDDLAVDTDTLFVDVSADRVGINTASPSVSLDVVGDAAISGTLTAGTFAPTDIAVDTDLIKTDSTNNRVGINNASPTEALDVVGKVLVSSDITTGGLLIADDSTSTSDPPITFTGDLNTGIGRSGADTLDFITGGNSRFRIESTGQIKAVYESQVGTDYNTRLDNGYLCRAWVNFNGTGTVAIRASGNVTSITDNGTGSYTINFTNAMPDVNYSIIGSHYNNGSVQTDAVVFDSYAVSSVRYLTLQNGSLSDCLYISVAVFR